MTPEQLDKLDKRLERMEDKIDKIESYIDKQKGGMTWGVMILTSVGGLGAFIYYLISSAHLWFTNTAHI